MVSTSWFRSAALLALLGALGCGTVKPMPGETRVRVLNPDEITVEARAFAMKRSAALKRALPTATVELERMHQLGEPSRINPQGMRVLSFKLSNGLRVLLLEDHAAPVFAYQTWFAVGSRHEQPGKTGIAHLFEHLMFKETKNLKEGEFDRIMESHGAETNAATWLDWTMYREQLPSSALELAVRLEADRMENMVLTEEHLESEREVVKNERRYRVDDDPEGTMFELLYATAFVKHPYHWPTIGWMADIDALSLEDCLAFYRTWYAPNNATIVLAGDLQPEVALGTVLTYYGHLPSHELPSRVVEVEPTQVAERRRTVVMPLTSAKLLFGYRIPELTHDDHAAVQVAHQILFGGDSGRLYNKLVVESELASDASAWVGEFAHPGLYEVLVTLKPGADPDRVELMIQDELESLATRELDQAELDGAKNQLEVRYLRNMQSVGDRAYGLGHYATTAGDFALLFEVSDRYREVDADDVKRVAARYFAKSRRTIITAVPAK
jgi:zinc protease